MSRSGKLWLILALALLLALLPGSARALAGADDSSPDDPSGAPASHRAPAVAPRAAPAGLDDMLQPLRPEAPSALAHADDSDLARLPRVASPVPVWKRLAAIDPALRAAANLELEFGSAVSAKETQLAAVVPALWSAGHHTAAIEALRTFEESGGQCAVGVSWKPEAGPAAPKDGGDVRLGGTRTQCENAVLDFDATTDRLFSVIRWGSSTAAYWTVNRSNDGGATWTETYAYYSATGIVDVSAAVVAGYVYVGYIYGSATDELRLRRNLVSTGASDLPYAFHIALNADTSSFSDISVVSNAENFDNRIYVVGIQADHELRFAWDVATDGLTFIEVTTSVVDAQSHLDASWANGAGCDYFLYASYLATGGYVHMSRYGTVPGWAHQGIVTGAGVVRPTSVSVQGTTVICAYEYLYVEGRGIQYSISYDCGSSWNIGTLAIPDGVAVASYMAPDVDARDGLGTAITYTAEVGEPDPAYYRYRVGFAPGGWEDALAFNDNDVVTGTETTIAHLSRLSPHAISHGAIYCGASSVPYFDYPGLGVVATPPVGAPAGMALRMAGANPARDGVRLELAMPRAGRADVRVYDVRGALVRTLASGEFAAGPHPIAWDGTNGAGVSAGAGLYFVWAHGAAGDVQLRLVLLK